MKVRVTRIVERECCEPDDLKLMPDDPHEEFYFCQYCGRQKQRITFRKRQTGEPASVFQKVRAPWEKSDASGHEWTPNSGGNPWDYCRRCGVVRRADGQNAPCPGRHPPITMRELPSVEQDIPTVLGLSRAGMADLSHALRVNDPEGAVQVVLKEHPTASREVAVVSVEWYVRNTPSLSHPHVPETFCVE